MWRSSPKLGTQQRANASTNLNDHSLGTSSTSQRERPEGCYFQAHCFLTTREVVSIQSLESENKTKEIQHKDLFFAPLSLLQNSLCLRFSYISKRKTARTQRISGVEDPYKVVDSGMGFLVRSLCLGVFFDLGLFRGCSFFAYGWKLPAYSGAFLLTIYFFSFSADNFSFFTYNWSFFAYNGKVRLIRALRDCKQRSLTVSKKAPTVSTKASPLVRLLNQFKAGAIDVNFPFCALEPLRTLGYHLSLRT